MSHFAVLVIGENVEEQLAPYHEFECTGMNDQYVQDIDITEDVNKAIEEGDSIENALGYYGLEDKIVDDESKVDKVGDQCEHKFGYAIVKDGKLIKAVDRTNPNDKWDWYQIGGRWSGFLKLKAGANGGNGKRSWMNRNDVIEAGYCDQATKGSVDFEMMRNKRGIEAAESWDKAYASHQGQTWEAWKVVGPRTNYDDVSREFYRNQPAVVALRAVFDNPFHDIDQYLTPREEYIKQERDKSIVLFAVIKDGQWYQRGEMGWWGAVSEEKDQEEWNRQFNELLDGLSDDTMLTVVDCHI